ALGRAAHAVLVVERGTEQDAVCGEDAGLGHHCSVRMLSMTFIVLAVMLSMPSGVRKYFFRANRLSGERPWSRARSAAPPDVRCSREGAPRSPRSAHRSPLGPPARMPDGPS